MNMKSVAMLENYVEVSMLCYNAEYSTMHSMHSMHPFNTNKHLPTSPQ